MEKTKLAPLFLSFFILLSVSDASRLLDAILTETLAGQFPKSTPYEPSPIILPPKSEQRVGGLWKSNVHINFVGNTSSLRHETSFIDNNFFVTAWILQIFFELEIAHADISNRTMMSMREAMIKAVHGLSNFHDKNHGGNDLAVSFWLQNAHNNSMIAKEYCATTENIAEPLGRIGKDANIIHFILNITGHEALWNEIGPIIGMAGDFLTAFGIPSDFDDSSVAVALSSFFQEFSSSYPTSSSDWFSLGGWTSDVSFFLSSLKLYAYRPFSPANNSDLIDPRTYYWIRHYLYELVNDSNVVDQDIALATTWYHNDLQDIAGFNKNSCYLTPLLVQNVDATVTSNVIYGLTRLFLRPVFDFVVDKDLINIYKYSSRLLTWIIKTGTVQSRPDLCLLYYPPRMDFYWFVSRSLRDLRQASTDVLQKYPFLDAFRTSLQQTFEREGTDQILSEVKSNATHNWFFWDGFLGLADETKDNQPSPHYDDRLFNTAMAVNALLNVWTVSDGNGRFRFLVNTPVRVREVLKGANNFLEVFILGNEYRKDNAFFSGSFKSPETVLWYYPGTVDTYANGTKLKPDNLTMSDISHGIITGVQGFVGEDEYEKIMKTNIPKGAKVPTKFNGYNNPLFPFPFWSSPSLTRASVALAVGKYDKVI